MVVSEAKHFFLFGEGSIVVLGVFFFCFCAFVSLLTDHIDSIVVVIFRSFL